MKTELSKYIKSEMANGVSVPVIYSKLQEKGWSTEIIDQAFRDMATTDTALLTQKGLDKSPTLVKEKSSIDLTKALLIIGAIFIGIAMVVVVTSQWNNVGPLGRILFLMLPMLALFSIYFLLRNRDKYLEIAETSLILSSLILPFFIGTFIYQLNIIHTLDSTIILASAMIAFPIYISIEYLLKKAYMGVFTLGASYTVLISFLYKFEIKSLTISWCLVALSLLVLVVGFTMAVSKNKSNEIYLPIGLLMLLATFCISVLWTLNENLSLLYETNAIITAIFGVLYLALVPALQWLYNLYKEISFYKLKRVLEEIAPMMILFPFLLIFNSIGYSLIALIISALMILVSVKVWTEGLIAYGIIGVIVSLMAITNTIFGETVTWPIIIFIIGFGAIGLGFLARKIVKERDKESYVPFYGFGIMPSIQNLPKKPFFE